MKKNRFLILLIVLISLFRFEIVNAANVEVKNDGSVSYGSWTTHKYKTSDSSKNNMYCVQPKLKAVYGSQPYEEVTNSSGWAETVKALYYSYDAPGWEGADMKKHYKNALGVAVNDEDGQYAYSHVLLSFFYHDFKGSEWSYGVPAQLISNITGGNNPRSCGYGDIVCVIKNQAAPPSTFHVYIIRKPYNQNLIFWKTIPEEKGNIVVQKNLEGNTAADSSKKGYKFRLYTNSSCTTKSSYSDKTTGTDGKASWTKVKFGTYYIGEVNLDTVKWEDMSKCVKVTLSKSSPKVGNKYTATGSYKNRRKWYVTKVYKTATIQKEDGTDLCTGNVNGAKFTLWRSTTGKVANTAEATTGGSTVVVHANADKDKRSSIYESTNCSTTDGTALFTMLGTNDGNWRVKETSSSSYTATVKCSNPNATYSIKLWNEGADNLLPSSTTGLSTKQMVYNSSTKKYHCPSGMTGTSVLSGNKKNNKAVYYCFRVRKIDSDTKEVIKKAATFTATNGSKKYEVTSDASTGIATFNVGINSGTYTVKEKVAPEGYGLSTQTKTVTASQMGEGVNANSTCSGTMIDFEDSKLVLNWYKVSEKNYNTMLNDAEFKVKNSSGTYIKFKSNPQEVRKGNVTKTCYIADANGSETALKTYDTKTTLWSGTNKNVTNTPGEICVAGVSSDTYVIEETKPAQYHAFGSKTSIEQKSAGSFYSKIITNTDASKITGFINCETEFELTKKVDNDITTDINDEQYKKTTEELRKLKFNVKYGNTVLKFKKISDGHYEYASGVSYTDNNNVVNLARSNDTVEDLQLDNNRKIDIKLLPHEFTYKIVEKATTGCKDLNQNACESQGFYYIEESESEAWSITTKSSKCSAGGGIVKTGLTNEVTEINFAKNDIYKYLDGSTNSEVESKLENDEEVKLFDTIDFVLKDASKRRLKLEFVKNVGTCNLTNANNGSAYALYRYVLDTGTTNTQEVIHTYCGNIKIKHLCRESTYYIEEISVPNNSVFILPTPHPEIEITIGKDKTNKTHDTETHIIDNTPTRVVFQKRDLKYGNIINETVGRERTTFNVYRCNDGIDPSACTTATSTLIKFNAREVIKDHKDKEDYGKEVYRYPDSQSNSGLVSDLHPYKGDLILRYLPAGQFKNNADGTKTYSKYNYLLVEVQAPTGYDTPTNGREVTPFVVSDETVDVDVVSIPNKPTKIILRKYDLETGQLLTGAKFKIYKVSNYDENRSVKNQEKTLMKLQTIRDGEYEYRGNLDTTVITTCIENCNEINKDLVTNEFINTDIGKDESKVEIHEGEAIVQYLEAENYYVIEEIESRPGYSLPDDESRFALVYIPNTAGEVDATVELYNTETPYQFYKFDEYNQLLDGAEFKLQKLNEKKKYVDVNVDFDEERTNRTDNANVYVVNEQSENNIITTKNGSAIIYRLKQGQYRILEVKAPEGKELPKKTINVATFFVDKEGKVYGSSIITNKPKTEYNSYNPVATAELNITLDTGQKIVRYGLIIGVLIALVAGLIIFQRKSNKKDE